MFNPRNKVEMKAGEIMRFFHPYLAFVTYRFHVEKARESGKYLASIFNPLFRPCFLQLNFIFNII